MLRGVEETVEVGVEKNACQQLRYRASIEQQLIRSKNRISIDPPGDQSTKYWGAIGIAIWKSLRSSTNSKMSRRYWGGVEPLFKTSFSRGEKHRYECNPTCNSINDLINTIIFQNHLSIKILKHIDLKNTHTHTKQV